MTGTPGGQVPQLLSVTVAAELLGCSRGHVYDLIKAGHLTTVNIGARTKAKTRLYPEDLRAFIESRTCSGTE